MSANKGRNSSHDTPNHTYMPLNIVFSLEIEQRVIRIF